MLKEKRARRVCGWRGKGEVGEWMERERGGGRMDGERRGESEWRAERGEVRVNEERRGERGE